MTNFGQNLAGATRLLRHERGRSRQRRGSNLQRHDFLSSIPISFNDQYI